jgi:membrane associated rhomboid family serine protease
MIPLRDENPTRITPYVTWGLIILNIIIFLLEVSGGMVETPRALTGWMAGWTMVPAEITQGRDYAINGPTIQPFYLTIFTSMFLHGGWLHLGSNMLYLFIFGNNIEDALGHFKYIVFYLLSGIAAAALQIFWSPDSAVPMLGASGAIAGVLGGYLMLYPRANVKTLVILFIIITVINVPAYLLLGLWIVGQFFSQFTNSMAEMANGAEQGGVAYLAHIGGFIAGMVLIRLMGGRPTRPLDMQDSPYAERYNTPYRRGDWPNYRFKAW